MKIDEIIEVFYMSRKKNRENAKTLEELAKGAEKLSQQFKQSIYNRIKEIMPKKLEMPDIELLRNNRYYKLHQTRNEAITECLAALGKELGVKE